MALSCAHPFEIFPLAYMLDRYGKEDLEIEKIGSN